METQKSEKVTINSITSGREVCFVTVKTNRKGKPMLRCLYNKHTDELLLYGTYPKVTQARTVLEKAVRFHALTSRGDGDKFEYEDVSVASSDIDAWISETKPSFD